MNISFNNTFVNSYFSKLKLNNIVQQNLTYPNLSPLKADTVSFSARAKLLGGDMKFAPPENLCRQITENSEPARFLLETVLNNYIGDLTSEKMSDDPTKKPVQSFTTRSKTSSSIKEKVVSKFSKITSSEANRFSAQVVDELSKYFELSPKTTKKDVLDDAKRVTKYSFSEDIKMPPYEHVDLFFDEIVAEMQLMGRYDFAAVSDERRAQIFDSIKAKLEDSNDSTHHLGTRYIDPTTVKGIKHYANDIVGGRIIMREAGPAYMGVVLDALKQAVDDGMLKINSIENNVPDPAKIPKGRRVEDYLYATNKQLKTLANAADAELIENKSKSGYLSVHLNITLSDELLEKYNGVFNGFDGEIQIIGQDVLNLKHVEDMCYKLKDNKNAIHEDYKPFKDYFAKYYQGEQVQKAFDDYTYALYLSQRDIPSGSARTTTFPSISELGFDGKVPPELDFNKLKTIKDYCDIVHKETIKAQEEVAEKSKSKKAQMQSIKRRSDITSVKNLIKYNYA